jgi:ribosome-associated protein
VARRPHSFTEEDFESLEGRASKTEQKKAVQRMASLGSQLAELILSYLTPQQGAKKTAQLQRWVDRMIKDGDVVINEFSKTYNAAERHTIRQHVLRIHRDMKQQADEEQLKASRLKLFNYIQQVALISDN